jgi:hypothetical protein
MGCTAALQLQTIAGYKLDALNRTRMPLNVHLQAAWTVAFIQSRCPP